MEEGGGGGSPKEGPKGRRHLISVDFSSMNVDVIFSSIFCRSSIAVDFRLRSMFVVFRRRSILAEFSLIFVDVRLSSNSR